MRKLFFCAILLILCVSITFGMAKKDKMQEQSEITITGLVKIYGNEPHTYVGFVSKDGKEYLLKAKDKKLKKIRKMQGCLIEISGYLASSKELNGIGLFQAKDGVIFVKSFAKKN